MVNNKCSLIFLTNPLVETSGFSQVWLSPGLISLMARVNKNKNSEVLLSWFGLEVLYTISRFDWGAPKPACRVLDSKILGESGSGLPKLAACPFFSLRRVWRPIDVLFCPYGRAPQEMAIRVISGFLSTSF